jgi:hypothetical protein
MDQVQHSLSRLALAKAIKTPTVGEEEAEPWNKSVIFNQPFIRELHKQRQQQQSINHSHQRYQLETKNIKQNHNHHCKSSSTSLIQTILYQMLIVVNR